MSERRSQPQADRLAHYEAEHAVDAHCHCLPGLDDGPETLGDALALCRALVADGITAVVATPHQLGRYDLANGAARVREAAEALRQRLAEAAVPLRVLVGADVRVDERVLHLLDADEVLTVADAGRHILLELPHESFFEPRLLIERLHGRNVQAIMTHPERHAHVCRRPQLLRDWVAAGAAIQVTAGSLVGDFGQTALASAWEIVSSGMPVVVAGDAHDTVRRPPRMTAACAAIERRLGYATARRTCIENPLRVAAGARCVGTVQVAVRRRVASQQGGL